MVDISVKNLTKFFVIGENLLEDLSFEVQEGECVAILGRNGCGKTTLFNILTGQMDFDAGQVYVPGFGYITPSGPNDSGTLNDMYENGNKIGIMGG